MWESAAPWAGVERAPPDARPLSLGSRPAPQSVQDAPFSRRQGLGWEGPRKPWHLSEQFHRAGPACDSHGASRQHFQEAETDLESSALSRCSLLGKIKTVLHQRGSGTF